MPLGGILLIVFSLCVTLPKCITTYICPFQVGFSLIVKFYLRPEYMYQTYTTQFWKHPKILNSSFSWGWSGGACCRMYIEYWLVVTAAGAPQAFYCLRKGKILLNEFDNTKYNLNHKWSGGGGKNYLLVALNPQPIPGPSLVIFRPQKAFCFFNISLPPRSKKITKRTLWSSYPPPQIMFWLCEKIIAYHIIDRQSWGNDFWVCQQSGLPKYWWVMSRWKISRFVVFFVKAGNYWP